MRYMIATRALTRGVLKILHLSEILPVYLTDGLFLSGAVPETNTADLVGFRGP